MLMGQADVMDKVYGMEQRLPIKGISRETYFGKVMIATHQAAYAVFAINEKTGGKKL